MFLSSPTLQIPSTCCDFATRNQVTASIILLVDDADNMLTPRWRSLGALDCLERRDLDSGIVRRVLDYSAQLGEARQAVKQLSNRDSLTGTLNRAGFRAHLERSIERSHRYGARTGLLYIDIDRFTQVNDHYGEGAGDEMICRIASRLLGKLRNTDSIARLGGDEFAVVLEDVSAPADIESVATKMLAAVSAPMALGQQQIAITASIGAACYPGDAGDFTDLVDAARRAMREAKALDGNRLVKFSTEIAFNQTGQATFAAELRTGLREDQFEPYYQPRIDLDSGELRGLEALLRWNHPTRGLLSPADFLPACEEMGLMNIIGHKVIGHACSAVHWLDEHGLEDVEVALNVSFSQLEADGFVEIVGGIIDRSGIDAARLEFELTEANALQDKGLARQRIEKLRDLGIRFSLDDFGTGFSQLSHLTELPISAIKIDAMFLEEAPKNPQHEAICAAIIEIARRLRMEVIAEGAETLEQIEFLRRHGCSQVQGFFFSPAIPLHRLPLFMQRQRWHRQGQLAL